MNQAGGREDGLPGILHPLLDRGRPNRDILRVQVQGARVRIHHPDGGHLRVLHRLGRGGRADGRNGILLYRLGPHLRDGVPVRGNVHHGSLAEPSGVVGILTPSRTRRRRGLKPGKAGLGLKR